MFTHIINPSLNVNVLNQFETTVQEPVSPEYKGAFGIYGHKLIKEQEYGNIGNLRTYQKMKSGNEYFGFNRGHLIKKTTNGIEFTEKLLDGSITSLFVSEKTGDIIIASIESNKVQCYEKNLKLKWTHDTGKNITDIKSDDTNVYISTTASELIALNAADGTVVYRKAYNTSSAESYFASVYVAGNFVYLFRIGKLYKLDKVTGDEITSKEVTSTSGLDSFMTTGASVGDNLFLVKGDTLTIVRKSDLVIVTSVKLSALARTMSIDEDSGFIFVGLTTGAIVGLDTAGNKFYDCKTKNNEPIRYLGTDRDGFLMVSYETYSRIKLLSPYLDKKGDLIKL